MARPDEQLGLRAQKLTEEGADALRIEVLECARQFKRSWVRMAEALTRVRKQRAYETWGYADLYAYCAEELLIKRATVDKLTGSFATIERHAPALLKADGLKRPIPSLDAVDYFARAVGEQAAKPAAPKIIDELRQAVFDEQRPVSALRRDFNELLHAKTDEQRSLESLERARAEVRKLTALLPAVRGLSTKRRQQVEAVLHALQHDLEQLIDRHRRRGARARA